RRGDDGDRGPRGGDGRGDERLGGGRRERRGAARRDRRDGRRRRLGGHGDVVRRIVTAQREERDQSDDPDREHATGDDPRRGDVLRPRLLAVRPPDEVGGA